MVISASIIDLDVDASPVDILQSFIDVENGRLVVVREVVIYVIPDQGGLTNWCASYEHHFDGRCSLDSIPLDFFLGGFDGETLSH